MPSKAIKASGWTWTYAPPTCGFAPLGRHGCSWCWTNTLTYIPDFLVHFHSGIREIWEVKPAELLGDPKVQAKIAALNDYVVRHEMNGRIVTLADLEGMERKTALMFAMRPF